MTPSRVNESANPLQPQPIRFGAQVRFDTYGPQPGRNPCTHISGREAMQYLTFTASRDRLYKEPDVAVTSNAANPNTLSLMNLPRELRNHIYFHALGRNTLVRLRTNLDLPTLSAAARCILFDPRSGTFVLAAPSIAFNLLLTNKTVHREAAPYFFGLNMFVLSPGCLNLPCYTPLPDGFAKHVRFVEVYFSNEDAAAAEPQPELRREDMVLSYDAPARTWMFQEPRDMYVAEQESGSVALRRAWEDKVAWLGALPTLRELVVNFETCFWRDGHTRAVEWVVERVVEVLAEKRRKGERDVVLRLKGTVGVEEFWAALGKYKDRLDNDLVQVEIPGRNYR